MNQSRDLEKTKLQETPETGYGGGRLFNSLPVLKAAQAGTGQLLGLFHLKSRHFTACCCESGGSVRCRTEIV